MANACGGTELTKGVAMFRESDTTPNQFDQITKIIDHIQPTMTAATEACDDPEAEAADGGFVSFYKDGSRDAGEWSFTYAWKSGDTVQNKLYDDFLSDDEHNYRLVHPDDGNTTITFRALLTEWGEAIPNKGRFTRTIKLRVNGQPVFS